MKAIGVPAQITASAVEPVSAATPAAQGDGADFVGMLMQLLGGNAAAGTTATPATKLPSAAVVSDDLEDPDALAAMLALPLPTPLPWAAQPTIPARSADPLQLLGLDAGGKGSADALLALKTALAETALAGSAGESGNGIGSLTAFNEALQARATQAEAVAARTLHTPVGAEKWADELGTRMTWMVDRGQQAASLRLSPENLGPLEVRISITDDKASVWFGAAHADTRAAIELALPRLREMFAAQGMLLADAGVFREPPRDQPTTRAHGFDADPDGAQQEGEVMISTRAVSLLDAYA